MGKENRMTDGIMLAIASDGTAKLYEDDYDITIHCESKEEQEKAIQKLNRLNDLSWHPVMDGDGAMPPVDEEGNSGYLLLSFSNVPLVSIGEYKENEGGGAFYNWDSEKPYTNYGMYVNAWMKLPERWEDGED